MSVAEGGVLRSRVCSRVGLLGNPSDGFEGACLSLSLANFAAEVTLAPSPTLRILPNPQHDPQEWEGLPGLACHIRSCGYYGGVRLLQAMCVRLHEYCQAQGIVLPPQAGNFTLSYTTTIPRQCGLSGSSAIACAALNCLLAHYGLEAALPVADRPQLVLDAEQELGITAGLQDRVIQVYGGLMCMDFSPGFMQQHGHGRYESLDLSVLPPLYLLYCTKPAVQGKDSGKVHSDVKQRWLAGDPAVRQGMQQIAALADQGRQSLLQRDVPRLAQLMSENFRLRRQLYGDAVVGAANLAMVEAAQSVGAAAKLTGSGGAVVALCPEGEQQAQLLQQACAQRGFECVPVEVGPALHTAVPAA